jgi:hypothetical protein
MGCKIAKPESCDTMDHGSSVDKSAGSVSSSGLHGGLHGRHHQYACGPCWNGKLLQWLVTTTSLTRSGLLVCDDGGIFGLRMEVEHSTSGVTPPWNESNVRKFMAPRLSRYMESTDAPLIDHLTVMFLAK